MTSKKKSDVPDNAVEAVFPARSDSALDENDEAAIAAAEQAIRNQASGYLERLQGDLKTLQAMIGSILASPSPRLVEIDHVYALLHNTKGQAQSFGYGLVTQICALACGILQRNRHPDENILRAVKAHIDALDIVVSHNLAGDGGALGQQMVSTLEGLAVAAGG
jgi:hypothetical protein